MAQKDVGNKIPIYKLKTTDEVIPKINSGKSKLQEAS